MAIYHNRRLPNLKLTPAVKIQSRAITRCAMQTGSPGLHQGNSFRDSRKVSSNSSFERLPRRQERICNREHYIEEFLQFGDWRIRDVE